MVTIAAAVNQSYQLGFEASYAAGGTAPYAINALMIEPTDELSVKEFTPPGHRFENTTVVDKQWTSWALSAEGHYTEVLYILENIFGTVAPTTVDVDAYQRVYSPLTSGIITPRSWVNQWGDANNVNIQTGMVASEFGMKYDRDAGISMTAAGFGITKTTGGAFTATPTPLTNVPMAITDVNYYLDSTSGGLGTTQVPEELISVEFSVKGMHFPYWATNRAKASVDQALNAKPTYEVKLLFAESVLARSVETALRSGATRYLRINALSPVGISGSSPAVAFNLISDFAIKGRAFGKYEDAKGVYAREFTCGIAEDTSWTHAALFTSLTDKATLT